jgi:hypothetical protein
MIFNKIVTSNEAPSVKDAIWKKPVEGGFTLYGLDGGLWKALKLVDDNGTPQDFDNVIVKAEKAIQEVKVNGSKLTPSSAKSVNIKIETGATLGSVKVNGTDVAVKGLAGQGTFANKPASPAVGEMYFATDKGYPVWYDGTNWVDATGTSQS